MSGRATWRVGLLLAVLAMPGNRAQGQLRISGQLDLLASTTTDERELNTNFRKDSPFNPFQVRIFGQHWVNDRMGVFTEALFDSKAAVRLNGAYLVVNDLFGRGWLSLRAGLAPSLIGSFGLRSSYYNSNPLAGVPLVWQYRTTLDASGLASNEDMLRRRDQNIRGLPLLYDSCWNLQWEFMGEVGHFEYSVGVTPGSISNPKNAVAVDGVQWLARLGVEPVLGLRLGVSGAFGPYVGGPNRDDEILATSFPGGSEDYDQLMVGIDLEFSRGKARFLSEAYVSMWEAPLVAQDLTAKGGYVEGRYDFRPEWFGAVRVGAMFFGDISAASDGSGPKTGWDDDVLRVESSLTYRMARELQLQAGWQHNEFVTGKDEPEDLLIVQLRAVF